MANICSVGLGIPDHEIAQSDVKDLVQNLFPYDERKMKRLLPIFDNAEIDRRQLVVNKNWFSEHHTFEEKNNLYIKYAKKYSLEAIDHCLTNKEQLKENIPFDAIDLIIFVSSTGISTPSLDVHLMNERPFRENVSRMPLWGLGCAGGAIGLSRAYEWLSTNPEKIALIVCCELCSLTFQKEDTKKSNWVGTALFGDGVGAALLMGEQSSYLSYRKHPTPAIKRISSFTEKNSTSVMGWGVSERGLEVIFSKSIPALVKTVWKKHIISFLNDLFLTEKDIHSFITHPGGKKVLEAMEETLSISNKKIIHSHYVLRNHGNMSSATVLYVLYEWMKETVSKEAKSVLSALGPGFSSELLLLEWN